jgi:predicted MFS family arabinose efflux permease
VAGVPAGLWLAATWSWHAPFVLLAVLGVVVWTVGALTLSPMRLHLGVGARPNPFRVVGDVLRQPNHWRAFALTVTLMFAGFSVIPFLSPYLVANVGLTEHHLALVYLLGGVCTVITSPLIGRLVDRVGAVRMFTIIGVLSLAPILVVTHLPRVDELLILVITTLFVVLVSGRFVPAMTLITGSSEPRLRGAFMSVNTAIQSLASGAAATLAGHLIARPDPAGPLLHYGLVGMLAAGATVLAMLLAARVTVRS